MSDTIIRDEKGRKLVLLRPPADVFLNKEQPAGQHTMQQDAMMIPAGQNELIPEIDLTKGFNGVTYPETGGMYVWHKGREYPRKGHVYPEALRDCYYPKRILINWMQIIANKDMILFFLLYLLLPKKFKGRILNRIIDGYLSIAHDILQDHFLHPAFYMDIGREIAQPIMTFLTELGAERMRAAKMALCVITLIEYDMAYRLRIEDILSETTKEKLLADPVGEARRLVRILAERDPSRPHLVEKFDRFARAMKYGFFLIRKPFRKAMAEIKDFSKMQLDEIDRYHVRHWSGYNWFGMTLEERVKKWEPVSSPAVRLMPDNLGQAKTTKDSVL